MEDDDDDQQLPLEVEQQSPQLKIRYEEVFTLASPGQTSSSPSPPPTDALSRSTDNSTAGRPRRRPQGDKILLPPSALEGLLSAAARARQQANSAASSSNGSRYGGRSAFGSLDDFHSFGYGRGGGASGGDGYDLPQPLTFRLASASTGKSVYAGIREFSAREGEVVLSDYLTRALGLGLDESKSSHATDAMDTTDRLVVTFYPLPKGTFVHLRPLAAGYNPADWRPLLERQLREGYTTLTRGAEFTVRSGHGTADEFRFRVDGFKPAGDGICVVDTDLEVDIEALDEEQARETLRQIQGDAVPLGGGNGAPQGSDESGSATSPGSAIDIWKPVSGQVRAGEYVDYELPSWDRSRPLAIVLSGFDEEEDKGCAVDLLVSPYSSRHRARPRETEHVWANFGVADGSTDNAKTIVLQADHSELEAAEALWISVHGWKDPDNTTPSAKAHSFILRAKIVLEDDGGPVLGGATEKAEKATDSASHAPDEEQCKNCGQWVPSRSMVLHENFCLRNNVVCPTCKQVFAKRSEAWANHWHCALDPSGGDDGGHGTTTASKTKHDLIFHPGFLGADRLYHCPADTCAGVVPPFTSLPDLARHRTTSCPSKLILCQFCQLEVPQEGDPTDPSVDAATQLTGQTPHERADGARTTDCYLCGAIVRMRDMGAHLQHHDLDRQRRVPPDVCRDALCGRTRFGVGPKGHIKAPPAAAAAAATGDAHQLGLCSTCFAPLYVSTHDPEGKALRRRVERRYLAQLLTGCGKAWCANRAWCKTARANHGLGPFAGPDGTPAVGTGALLPLVKPLVAEAVSEPNKPVHFCVDEETQKRRAVAELLAGQGGGVYELAWCVAACEAEGADATLAWEWLNNWAPQKRAGE
ncbi:ubiquitin fusion degradation protein [Sporothrix brasiliensis 5110]|uniref:Ubiquitin fusion degradation protein n=1 Tax=Sporothrix brasiliensis 5110 TaxID=1398154 RepID=A0A0C2ITW8_9PEZI|nr:ubiquitin fusion degradation protein [Sporothrix brasiliensis 5110]KIH92546.1 ubiquitin fusion degradation protein [Sporothrix brasiliensis 5110]